LIRHLPKITCIATSLSALFLCLNTQAAVKTYENTWFEIEVILFSQLGDKSQLQEVFPETNQIPTPSRIIDLLGPYLTPNIVSLKSRVATCDDYLPQKSDTNYETEFTQQSFTLTYTPPKTNILNMQPSELSLFSALGFEHVVNDIDLTKHIVNTDEAKYIQAGETLQEFITETAVINTAETTDTQYSSEVTPITDALAIDTLNTDTLAENTNIEITEETVQEEPALTTVFTEFNVPQTFCTVPEHFFNDYKKEVPEFDYNDVPLDTTPLIISSEEDLTTDRPYFIHRDSLKLQDIVKQLRRSRNFRPLMHMGWRQKTKLKKDAIPLKLYAGENLMQPYDKALQQYNRQQQQLAIEEAKAEQEQEKNQNEAASLNIESNHYLAHNDTRNNEAKKAEIALNQTIHDILKQAVSAEPTLETVLNELNNGPEDVVTPLTNEGGLTSNIPAQQLLPPEMPPQAWTIEGFLKVEVAHFLHITAEFNVVNMSLAEQATRQLATSTKIPLRSIRFEQDKRVRSKEIHYFDHPYMGMIVQIRRHKQVPPIESNDQELGKSLAKLSSIN